VPPRRTLTLAGLVTAAAGIALFIWLTWTAGPKDVWAGVQQVGWGLVAIIAIAGVRFALRGAAWRRCLEPPHTLRMSEAFTAVVSGDALGNVTPLGPLASEPAKVAFVRTRVPLGVAFTALAIENVFYTLSVAAVIAAGTIALLVRGIESEQLRLAAEVAIGVVLAAYAGVAWVLLRQPALLSRLMEVVWRLSRSARLHSRMEKIRRLEQDIYTFASRRRETIGPLIATELGFHALGVLEVHLTLWLLGDQPRLADSFIFETTNRLSTVLFKFVPQQPGLNEGATVLTAQLLGLSFQTGLNLGIVRRVRMLFWQLTGMILLVRHGISTRRILADEELTNRSLHRAATPDNQSLRR
jgi:uncharacterized protein (TIRG00374 family)